MLERSLIFEEAEIGQDLLDRQDVVFLQCAISGWTGVQTQLVLSRDVNILRNELVCKMSADESLHETIQNAKRLPFVSENFLTAQEGMVAFLKDAGLRIFEISRAVEIDSSNVGKSLRKIGSKRIDRKDSILPEYVAADGVRAGMAKAINIALKNDLLDTSLIQGEPRSMLSLGESRAVTYFCMGLSMAQISKEMDNSKATASTMLNRARAKLGVGPKYELIGRTLLELIALEK